MPQPSPALARRALVAAALVLALALALVFAWRQWRMPVRAEEVASFLDRTMGAGKVRFSDVRIDVARLENGDLRLAVFATAKTLRPLYSKRQIKICATCVLACGEIWWYYRLRRAYGNKQVTTPRWLPCFKV